MINLDSSNNPFAVDSFFEGIINDALNSTEKAVGKIKDDFDKAEGATQKAKVLNDDAIEKMANAADAADKKMSKQKVSAPSIVARARRSVLQFPVYISRGIPVNAAHIISKLFERVYATLVQTALAMNPIIDEDEANNLVFLQKFHTNIKESTDLEILEYKERLVNEYYEPIDEIDSMIKESVFYQEEVYPGCVVTFRAMPTTNKDLITENRRLLNEPLTGFSYLKEDTQTTTSSSERSSLNRQYLTDQDLKEIAEDRVKLTDDEKEFLNKSPSDIAAMFKGSQSTIDKYVDVHDAAVKKVNDEIVRVKAEIKAGKLQGYVYDGAKYYRINKATSTDKSVTTTTRKDLPVETPKLLKEAEIKKINGMLPWTIEASFRIKGKNGQLDRDVKYLIGVKTVLHLINVEDLEDDLRDLVTGKIKSLRKVRYKTGEIGFLDYVFNIKQIKKDASKAIDYDKRWVNTLRRLAEYEKMNGSLLKTPAELLSGGNVPIPNGTLILSQSDVLALANSTGIDLQKISNCKRLCKSLFLIAIGIVDSTAGTMNVMFSDDNSWDTQSLASVEADINKTDNSALMKELSRKINNG